MYPGTGRGDLCIGGVQNWWRAWRRLRDYAARQGDPDHHPAATCGWVRSRRYLTEVTFTFLSSRLRSTASPVPE